MIRFFWIPAAGTIAAIIVVALTHGEREDFNYSRPNPRATRDDIRPPPGVVDPPSEPDPEPDEVDEPEDMPPPPPGKSNYILRLRADGSLVDSEGETEYKNAAEFLETVAPKKGAPRVTVTVMNDSNEVTEAALDAIGVSLQQHVDFRKDYRAPEKKSEEKK